MTNWTRKCFVRGRILWTEISRWTFSTVRPASLVVVCAHRAAKGIRCTLWAVVGYRTWTTYPRDFFCKRLNMYLVHGEVISNFYLISFIHIKM